MADRQVHEGHRSRLRERAVREGLDAFNPHQVLEFLLFYAIPRQDTSEAAHLLLDQFGSVEAVLTAPQEELMKVRGVGRRAAQWLSSVGCVMRNYTALTSEDRPRITNYKSVMEICRKWAGSYPAPHSFQICLTPDGSILTFSSLCDSLGWDDPIVLKRALDDVLSVHARHVILVELDDGPLEDDEDGRKRADNYAYLLGAMGVDLLDIVRMGGGEVQSLSQNGSFDRTRHGTETSILSEGYLREASESSTPNAPEKQEG